MQFSLRAFVLLCLLVALVSGQGRPLACKRGAHPCSDGSRCVPREFFCDGVFDCGNGEDESNCKNTAPISSNTADLDSERNMPTFGLEIGAVRNL